MCFAIPMQIVAIDGFVARCEARGVTRDVSLFLMQETELAPGDHVMVHVGYAIQKVSEDDARAAWALYDEMLEALDGEHGDAHA
ncbi:MAG TPA: HypC/HybG/HupF family hydrogenase formation chaperone [Gammaproteobacteria bacterium]|nr:HypC/HybG/HupF family hydrogenase formation chaperone [Gammaproteobacteria bacterium]